MSQPGEIIYSHICGTQDYTTTAAMWNVMLHGSVNEYLLPKMYIKTDAARFSRNVRTYIRHTTGNSSSDRLKAINRCHSNNERQRWFRWWWCWKAKQSLYAPRRHIGVVEVQLHPFSTSALDGREWSVSLSSRFTYGERTADTSWMGSWVSPTNAPPAFEPWIVQSAV